MWYCCLLVGQQADSSIRFSCWSVRESEGYKMDKQVNSWKGQYRRLQSWLSGIETSPCPQKFVVSSGISGPQTIEFKSHASLGYTSSSQPGLASMGMGLEAGVRIRPQAAGSWNGTRGWSRNRGARLSKGHPINSCLHTWDQCIENKDTGATPPQATGGLLWNNTPNYTPVLDPLQWMKATEPKST